MEIYLAYGIKTHQKITIKKKNTNRWLIETIDSGVAIRESVCVPS